MESGSSNYSFDSDDIQSLSSMDGRISSAGKVASHLVKKFPSPITPRRKSPRDHGKKPLVKVVEGDNDEEEEPEFEEVVKETQEDIKDDKKRKKWKRESLDDTHSQMGASMLPLSPIHVHANLEEQKEESFGNVEGEV